MTNRIDAQATSAPTHGTIHDDIIVGTAPNAATGYNGNDGLYGHGGNDKIFGGAGNDRLGGGAGDDLLMGGAGLDVMNGGDGAVVFMFRPHNGWSSERIEDFDYAEGDRIRLDGMIANRSWEDAGTQTFNGVTYEDVTLVKYYSGPAHVGSFLMLDVDHGDVDASWFLFT